MKTTKQRSSEIINKRKKIITMRKRIISSCLCLIMICSIGLTLGLVLFKQNFELTTDFTEYTMQISDAKSIGLEKTIDNQVRLVKEVESQAQTFSTKINTPLYEEILLKKEKSEYGVKLGDLNAEVYKMKVVGGFTFVSYISKNLRKNVNEFRHFEILNSYGEHTPCKAYNLYSTTIIDRLQGVPDNFEYINYGNDEFIKSYIIDNSTGKIYSTAQFKTFDIQDNLIKVSNDYGESYTYYRYYINNQGNLEIVALIPNQDIKVTYIHQAPDEVYYIFNKSINLYDEQNKFYYINTNLLLTSSKHYAVGSDGYVYLLEGNGPFDTQILRKLQNGTEISVLPNKELTFVYPTIYRLDYTIGNMFGIKTINQNNIAFISKWHNVYTEHSYIYNFETNEAVNIKQNSQNLTFSNNDFLILLKNNKVLLKRNTNVLSYADFNITTGEITNENVLLNDCTLKIGETTLVNGIYKTLPYTITVTTTTETKIYEAEVVNNDVQIKLIEHEIAQGEVFVIEPIN